MQVSEPTILFDRQEHQEACIERMMDALEERRDDHSLAARPDFDFDPNFPRKPDENRLDVLMETGTGKTYVYLKAIFEIHKRFGKTKFVIVVPRTSIKLGVLQNVRLTDNHFLSQYGRRLKCIRYPEDDMSGVVSGFIRTNELSVLLITNSAFNSKDNLVNKHTETLDGGTTIWEEIARQEPVVMIDEPHLLAGKKTTQYLERLRDKSLFIRFGATYPENGDGATNVVYVLDSITSFKKKLVKRIHVDVADSHTEEENVRVVNAVSRREFTIEYVKNGQPHKKSIKYGEDIGAVTGLDMYRGRHVTSINTKEVKLDDGKSLLVGVPSLTDDEMRHMIRRTIDLHFEREEEMFSMGIKTLSLFFIPYVQDFRSDSPRIKRMFEKEYREARNKVLAKDLDEKYRLYLKMDYQDGRLLVHDGYFSGDRGSKDEKVADGVDKILNNKKRLLSLEEPLRFVFSVWALQEGWDNPNIFNICKLSHTNKDTSRRQQVGRGLRIAVDQRGHRMTEDRLAERHVDYYTINDLNMIVSAYEHSFVYDIQHEIHDASVNIVGPYITLADMKNVGMSDSESASIYVTLREKNIIDGTGLRMSSVRDFLESNRVSFPDINDERFDEIVEMFTDTSDAVIERKPRKMVHIKENKWKEFKELWEMINRGSHVVYKNIDEESIISVVRKEFNNRKIHRAQTKITRYVYDSQNDRVVLEKEITSGDTDYFKKTDFHQNIMRIAKDSKWPIKFLLKLFNRIDIAMYKSNPAEAERQLIEIIRETIDHVVLEKVEYKFVETVVYGNKLQGRDGRVENSLPYVQLGKEYTDEIPPDEFLYDTVVYDSQIERKSILSEPMKYEDGDKSDSITVFAKLPRITIPTPFETYNPDFAYVVKHQNGQTLYLVVETKGYDTEREMRKDEQKKIDYAHRFFASLQKTLPDTVKVRFVRRLNTDTMSDILKSCYSD